MRYLLILSLFISACGTPQKSQSTTASEATKQHSAKKPGKSNCIPALINRVNDTLPQVSPARITSMTKKDGCLCLHFQYSGCQKGEPLLYRREAEAVGEHSLVLKMQEAGMCEMLIRDSACFDLSAWHLSEDGTEELRAYSSEQVVIW